MSLVIEVVLPIVDPMRRRRFFSMAPVKSSNTATLRGPSTSTEPKTPSIEDDTSMTVEALALSAGAPASTGDAQETRPGAGDSGTGSWLTNTTASESCAEGDRASRGWGGSSPGGSLASD
jgi:hypothetical protein